MPSCCFCGYTGSSVSRHVGTVHKAVDKFIQRQLHQRPQHQRQEQQQQQQQLKQKQVPAKKPRLSSEVAKPAKTATKQSSSATTATTTSASSSSSTTTTTAAPSQACFICQKGLNSRGALKSHVAAHYSKEIKAIFKVEGKKCPWNRCSFEGKYQ